MTEPFLEKQKNKYSFSHIIHNGKQYDIHDRSHKERIEEFLFKKDNSFTSQIDTYENILKNYSTSFLFSIGDYLNQYPSVFDNKACQESLLKIIEKMPPYIQDVWLYLNFNTPIGSVVIQQCKRQRANKDYIDLLFAFKEKVEQTSPYTTQYFGNLLILYSPTSKRYLKDENLFIYISKTIDGDNAFQYYIHRDFPDKEIQCASEHIASCIAYMERKHALKMAFCSV